MSLRWSRLVTLRCILPQVSDVLLRVLRSVRSLRAPSGSGSPPVEVLEVLEGGDSLVLSDFFFRCSCS